MTQFSLRWKKNSLHLFFRNTNLIKVKCHSIAPQFVIKPINRYTFIILIRGGEDQNISRSYRSRSECVARMLPSSVSLCVSVAVAVARLCACSLYVGSSLCSPPFISIWISLEIKDFAAFQSNEPLKWLEGQWNVTSPQMGLLYYFAISMGLILLLCLFARSHIYM